MVFLSKDRVIDRFAVYRSTEVRLLGGLLAILGLMFLVPGTYALVSNENPDPFFYPAIPLITTGTVLFLLFSASDSLRTVNGLIMIAVTWFTMFFVGAIPYLMVGMTPVNALFESVNGFTTSGSTTVDSVYYWPESLMLWRAMTAWLGGIAIVIIFIYILPLFGMGRIFFNNELEGSGSSNYSMKLQTAASSFITVYVVLTVINFLLLLLLNAPFLDSLCMSLTTISTGGILISDTSLIGSTTSIQLVTMIFMFIGGTNFYLHFKAISTRSFKIYLHNKELRNLIIYFFLASIILFIFRVGDLSSIGLHPENYFNEYWETLFTVISIGTTTGLAVYDFTQSSEIVVAILIILMMIGASAGSTSGGIKFSRIRIVMGFFRNSLLNILHPNAVYSVKVDNEDVPDSRVIGAVSTVLLYMVTVVIGIVILMSAGLEWVDSIGLAIGSVTNTGVGFGHYGPLGDYDSLGEPLKIVLMFLMWIGRLEISIALVFFTPAFWREVKYSYRSSKKYRNIRNDQ